MSQRSVGELVGLLVEHKDLRLRLVSDRSRQWLRA
jgi:hypothetical protein